ncbi:unnamed protein product [Rotaria sp. Silwood1]|nr:unnamed protein product [Rotaria sp. Silwood1]CAF1612983.1 unnamed protein product [Rotaria sp. Silwood1]
MFYRWLKQSERTFLNPESFPCCLSTVSDKENTLVKEQKEFEKSLFTKTCKGSEDVILLDNLTIAYRNNVDLLFNVVDNPVLITQSVQLRSDDIPLGEQTISQPLASLSIFHPTFLGLCNNFVYVVMLSAAHDILKQEESDNSTQPVSHNTTNQFDCNPISTGVTDILPALVIKITAAFFMHKILYNIRFVLIVLFAASALIIVRISKVIALSIFGVVCASISAGFGEITMLQLTSFYEKYTVSAWSSGTGAAGLLGALSYAGLTSLLKLSPRTAILILLFIPVLQVISYIMVGASQTAAKHREYQQISSHIVLIRR